MTKFGKHEPTTVTGRQSKFKFANGYGASVINDGYGGDRGLYELGVLGPDENLTYQTPITDDVLGYLTPEGVADALDQIEALTETSIIGAQIEKERNERDVRIAELEAELAELRAARENETAEASR